MLSGISAVGTVKRSSRRDERQGGLCSRGRDEPLIHGPPFTARGSIVLVLQTSPRRLDSERLRRAGCSRIEASSFPEQVCSNAWRGAALDRTQGTSRYFSLGACIGHKSLKTGGSRERLDARFVSWCVNEMIQTDA
jgi:hypothetical protein